MKILHINSFDKQGGAAVAVYRIHKALIDIGVESRMLVQHKTTDDYTVIGASNKIQKIKELLNSQLNRFPLTFYPDKNKSLITPGISFNKLSKVIENLNPDIVHLHWIANGFVDIDDIKNIKKPIVWTLHDMWPFTGGCHYTDECNYYQNSCGKCPILSSKNLKDLSYKTFKRKKSLYEKLNITFIAPGSWILECASLSVLLTSQNKEVINHGMNINDFKNIDKMQARNILNLPSEKQFILFGAVNAIDDNRKGYNFLKESLNKLSTHLNNNIELIIFGASKPEKNDDFNINSTYFGHLYDEISLRILYSAADVMIVPSKQESFGLTALEAMACGTPVVAFDTTGLKDIIQHKKTGYLAHPYDSDDLAIGIKWLLEDKTRLTELSINSRKLVEKKFDIKDIAQKHKELYTKISNK